MYLIKIHDGTDDKQGTVIHTPYANGEKLTSGNIKLVGDGIDSFEFSVNPNNPAWDKIRPLVTLITITSIISGALLFDGRILKPTQTMTSNGQFNIKYTAESKLAYLHDSTQRHGEYNNMTVRDFLVEIIAQHNRQVEPHKRFEVGEVTVTTNTDNIYRFLGYEKTWDAIQDKLIDRLGGHIRLREGKYIDYLESVGELRNTPIRLRTNLKDMQKEIDPTEIITRLVPLGARLETEESSSGISEPRLTIESVNNGKDYIDDQALINEFGIIEGNVTWDDVNTPFTLLLRGQQFFQAQKAARISYDVTASNLNLIDTTFEEFEVDNYYPFDNPVLAINEPVQVTGKDIDINNPQTSKLQIGDKHRTLSGYQTLANKQTKSLFELSEQVSGLSVQNNQLIYQLNDTQAQLQITRNQIKDLQISMGGPLRVATFNIWQSRIDIEAYKRFVTSNRLDIIGLQEVLETTPESLRTHALDNIKYEGSWYNYGNAVQSNFIIKDAEVFELPSPPDDRQILMKTSVEFGEEIISVYNTHLDAQEDDTVRLQQLEFIKQVMDADVTKYKILTGDFNVQDKAHYELLGDLKSAQGHNGVWHDTWDVTIEPWNNGAIDNVLVTPNIDILRVEMPLDKMGSDHYMIWAEIALRQ